MKRKLLSCLALLLGMFLVIGSVTAEAAEGEIDYAKRLITVKGMGAAPPMPNPAQARMLARRAAVADAYRQLAETVKGVQVDSETSVEMYMVKSDIVRTKVSAMIQGAQVVAEQAFDGGYEVTMVVPMFGVQGSVAAAVLTPPPVVEAFPEPAPEVIPSMPADSNTTGSATVAVVGNGPSAAIGGYTGLIIDCRGLGLQPVMSPVVKNDRGVKLYGHENLNYDLVIRDGMADYANNESMLARAGAKPLIVKAIRVEDHNANPVISAEDGNRVLIENGSSGFLNKTAVVFLY